MCAYVWDGCCSSNLLAICLDTTFINKQYVLVVSEYDCDEHAFGVVYGMYWAQICIYIINSASIHAVHRFYCEGHQIHVCVLRFCNQDS